MHKVVRRACLVALLVLTANVWAQDLASIEKRVTVKKLDNGLTLIIYERPEAPVFSYATVANVGAAQEVPGITGLAHMFEHMAFKGTTAVGTTDAAAENAALQKVEDAYAAYDVERRKTVGHDDAKVAQLEKAWKDALDAAQKYVVPNEFSKIADQAGAVGMNAFTQADQTVYFFSMPSNRLELWAYLESGRFLNPVFREFYKERDVVMEERRMRTESTPIGRALEQFTSVAFLAHPYHNGVIGWPSDLRGFSASDAETFFKKYYIPSNLVVAVVGDVKASEAMPLLEKYFGRLPKAPEPEPLRTIEPQQKAERTVVLHEQAQPIYLEGYHRPAITDPDNAVYDVLEEILSDGRTSRMYRSLVRDKKIASVSAGFTGFPGNKYPHLFAFFAFPLPGHTPHEIEEAIHVEIERLKKEDITDDELKMIKTRAKANLVRGLAENEGLAFQLGQAQSRYGDWRESFRQVDRIDKVTKADIRRVANQIFVSTNRTVGIIENIPAAATTKGGQQ